MTADPAGLTVVAGQPTAEELAALTAAVTGVLAARAAGGRAAAARRPAGQTARGCCGPRWRPARAAGGVLPGRSMAV